MTDRERLIELIDKVLVKYDRGCLPFVMNEIADCLLANGVIVLPCKVGDTVWEIDADNPFEEELQVIESKVERFYVGTSHNLHLIDCKTVFLTKEEAERALKERERE
jgi:hypothetical protein